MKQRPYLAMLLGSLIIGSSPIFIRGTDAPGPISSLYRMLIGAGVMTVPFLLNLWKQRQVSATIAQIQPERNARRGIFFAVLSGVFIGIDMSFWSTGIVISGPTIPTLMANTAPLWVGLGTWLFFRERRGVGFWVGLVVALLGVSLILGQDLSAAGNVRLGAIFGIVSAFFYGLYYLAAQPGREHVDTLTFFWFTTLASAVTLGVINVGLGHNFGGYSAETWLNFGIMGVLVQALGWMVIIYAQGHLPAAIVAPFLLMQPVITATLSAILFGERFTRFHFIGAGLVLTGILLVHRAKAKKE